MVAFFKHSNSLQIQNPLTWKFILTETVLEIDIALCSYFLKIMLQCNGIVQNKFGRSMDNTVKIMNYFKRKELTVLCK